MLCTLVWPSYINSDLHVIPNLFFLRWNTKRDIPSLPSRVFGNFVLCISEVIIKRLSYSFALLMNHGGCLLALLFTFIALNRQRADNFGISVSYMLFLLCIKNKICIKWLFIYVNVQDVHNKTRQFCWCLWPAQLGNRGIKNFLVVNATLKALYGQMHQVWLCMSMHENQL